MGAPAAVTETLPAIGSIVEAVGADTDRPPAVEEIESLCMRCYQQGVTRLLLTKIPHFRELVLMAFECPHCGETNNEVTFAGSLQPWGCRITLTVPVLADSSVSDCTSNNNGALPATRNFSDWMNRQVVKSDSASISVPELEFEIPPEAQRGTLTTVEGVLARARDDLAALQEERRQVDAAAADKIDAFLGRLQSCIDGQTPFTLILDDPSGNSYIESSTDEARSNPNGGQSGASTANATVSPAGIKIVDAKDPWLVVETYERTPEQNAQLGYLPGPSLSGIPEEGQEGEGEAGGDGISAPAAGTSAQASQPSGADLMDKARAHLAVSQALQQARAQAAGAGGSTGAAADSLPHGTVGAQQAFRSIAQAGGDKIESQEAAQRLLNYSAPEEVMVFPATCGACSSSTTCETRMYATAIPYFKEVIIMATSCDECGWKSSELKPGGEVSKKAKKITLHIKTPSDLTRDVIKSDTAAVYIPELDVELGAGTMGGMVTTVEGLVSQIADSLARVRPFEVGDSAPEWRRTKWAETTARLRALAEGRWEEALEGGPAGATGAGNLGSGEGGKQEQSSEGEEASASRQGAAGDSEEGAAGAGLGGGVAAKQGDGWHLVLDDALANSFVSFAAERMEEDPQLAVEEYRRSWEQDEELGLHGMDTGEGHAADRAAGDAGEGGGPSVEEK